MISLPLSLCDSQVLGGLQLYKPVAEAFHRPDDGSQQSVFEVLRVWGIVWFSISTAQFFTMVSLLGFLVCWLMFANKPPRTVHYFVLIFHMRLAWNNEEELNAGKELKL